MLFIQYPPCSTCQKAKKWLDEHGLNYTERHIKEDNPGYDELKSWYEMSGLPLKRFFNTSGLLYKSMNLKDRLPAMSEDEQLRLLATDGMLVKRPIIVDGETVLTGFREAEWECLLKSAHLKQAARQRENIVQQRIIRMFSGGAGINTGVLVRALALAMLAMLPFLTPAYMVCTYTSRLPQLSTAITVILLPSILLTNSAAGLLL